LQLLKVGVRRQASVRPVRRHNAELSLKNTCRATSSTPSYSTAGWST